MSSAKRAQTREQASRTALRACTDGAPAQPRSWSRIWPPSAQACRPRPRRCVTSAPPLAPGSCRSARAASPAAAARASAARQRRASSAHAAQGPKRASSCVSTGGGGRWLVPADASLDAALGAPAGAKAACGRWRRKAAVESARSRPAPYAPASAAAPCGASGGRAATSARNARALRIAADGVSSGSRGKGQCRAGGARFGSGTQRARQALQVKEGAKCAWRCHAAT
jgi:hypothetical protein